MSHSLLGARPRTMRALRSQRTFGNMTDTGAAEKDAKRAATGVAHLGPLSP